MINNNFIKRHNGPREADVKKMLEVIGVKSEEQLIDEIISKDIRLPHDLNIGKGMNEYEFTNHLKAVGAKNKIYRSYIGMGYYNTITPGVITRNVLENPGWYTSYTPYQAEVSQGRLEALLNFQTVICDMTAMPLANASLLDEATAAAEAMIMFFNSRSRAQMKADINKFFVADNLFPQTVEVIKTRAHFLNIDVVVGDVNKFNDNGEYFGIIVQCPDQYGRVIDYGDAVKAWKEKGSPDPVSGTVISFSEHDTSIAATAAIGNKSFFMICPPVSNSFPFSVIRCINTVGAIGFTAGCEAVFNGNFRNCGFWSRIFYRLPVFIAFHDNSVLIIIVLLFGCQLRI